MGEEQEPPCIYAGEASEYIPMTSLKSSMHVNNTGDHCYWMRRPGKPMWSSRVRKWRAVNKVKSGSAHVMHSEVLTRSEEGEPGTFLRRKKQTVEYGTGPESAQQTTSCQA
ncbi:hypothetical protein Krac_2946 [Ktedonobacter racemifer DSM 44963]|uniref:Uncharacterized protein n=1 Tax=Ktedonobacter racemifer DSM 44963 TaxID=485913 RepID=D6U021_KTERA|nr:hypothetical protein Krac_2946 [Ktedonobacter racemifer DSM 44963]